MQLLGHKFLRAPLSWPETTELLNPDQLLATSEAINPQSEFGWLNPPRDVRRREHVVFFTLIQIDVKKYDIF